MAGVAGGGRGVGLPPGTTANTQIGILIDKGESSPLARRPSRADVLPGAKDDYSARHDAAASKIGKVLKGGADRKKVVDKYYTETREMEPCCDPMRLGLSPYAELNDSMPEVSDDRRYSVRDVTTRNVLLQLGAREQAIGGYHSFESDAFNILQDITRRTKTELTPFLRKQMEMARLFVYQDATTTPSSASNASGAKPSTAAASSAANAPSYGVNANSANAKQEAKPDDPKYLLGKFESLAIPARADFDWAFDPIRSPSAPSTPSGAPDNGAQPTSTDRSASTMSRGGSHKGGQVGNFTPIDCDSPAGFAGWFWILHEGAPNIGESSQAEEFLDYCRREEDPSSENANSSAPELHPNGKPLVVPTWKERPSGGPHLDEDMYVNAMYHLWRLSLLAMARLGVSDVILFPFGMGAFLRHLGKNDERYLEFAVMRNLRRRVADELMKAIVSVYGNVVKAKITSPVKDLPQRLHLCLMFNGPESAENHNCFVEAAGDIIKASPGVADLLQLRRNVDSLHLANKLAADLPPLKVGVLNGANRKLIGNHWFQKGARNAIDENLHRRSSSMTRAALLLNMGTEPVERRPGELSATLTWLGGKVEALSGTQPKGASAAAAPAAKASSPAGAANTGGFLCCKKRSGAPVPAKAQGAPPPTGANAPTAADSKRNLQQEQAAAKKDEAARKAKEKEEQKAKAKSEAAAKAKAKAAAKGAAKAKAKAKSSV